MQVSTLRPGFLVSLKTSVRGNVAYRKQTIEEDHYTGDGSKQARWETERTITDPVEHEAARKARSRARSVIYGACAISAFGLLCPESSGENLTRAVEEARRIVDEFNASANITRVSVYVITGRIAPDDVEAVKAINSEVRDLMGDMAEGIKNLDVKAIRDAASRAKSIGNMLSPNAQARITIAIEAARSSAKEIVKAGEQAAQEVDNATIRKIAEQRTAFLDLDEQQELKTPSAGGRALDLTPSEADWISNRGGVVAAPKLEVE